MSDFSKGSDQKDTLFDKIKEIWAPIAGFIGAAATVANFIQLWRGDSESLTWIVFGLGLAILIFSLVHLGFSRTDSIIKLPHGNSFKRPRYPGFYKAARVMLAFVAMLSMVFGIMLYKNILDAQGKLVVLITNIDGPDADHYRITEQLISQLREVSASYKDIVIRTVDETITEQQGAERSLQLGRRYQADLVLWGWYGVTQKDALITIHVENLTNTQFLAPGMDKAYQSRVSVDEIQDFKIQQQLSDDISTLIFCVSGVFRFETGDYAETIRIINSAFSSGRSTLYPSAGLYWIRGQSYLYVGENKKAVADFTRAIDLNDSMGILYESRGYAYMQELKFQEALDDFSATISLDSNNIFAYTNRGMLYSLMGEPLKAINDLNRGIDIDSNVPALYNNRGLAYSDLGETQKAIDDYSKAVTIP